MDNINHPLHYTSSGAVCRKCGEPIECIDITQNMGFCLGNALKYIWRCGKKDSAIEDLQKAVWYINKHIDNISS